MGKKAKKSGGKIHNANKNNAQNHNKQKEIDERIYNKKYPFVSICTPTFNRRPFFFMTIKCFKHQDYPMDRIEWVIIDDGTDKIEDLVKDIPQVKYFKYDTQLLLGKKRNIMHQKATGDIFVYMDDDDYYPPDRVSHAVETLQANPQALAAGSSEMYMYFKHIHTMYQCGPYGKSHSTAGTFALRREILTQTSYDENAGLAEEKAFLKNYTIPFVQLDPMKSILVFSHIQNTFDKRRLLEGGCQNNKLSVSTKTVDDFITDTEIKQFIMVDIDDILSKYSAGDISNKPKVLEQINKITEDRERENQTMIEIRKQNLMREDTKQLVQLMNTQLKDKLEEAESRVKEKTVELNIIFQKKLDELNAQLKEKIDKSNEIITRLNNENTQLKGRIIELEQGNTPTEKKNETN